MRLGFHVYIDHEDNLAFFISDSKRIRHIAPVNITEFLIDFIAQDFKDYLNLLIALDDLQIFKYMDVFADDFESTLDVSEEDYLQCQEVCKGIAKGLEDKIGSHFAAKEINRICKRPDDGSASYWLNQASDMVKALWQPVKAHTFISRAFDRCYGDTEENSLPTCVVDFLNSEKGLYKHTFTETFEILPHIDGRLDYNSAVTLLHESHGNADDFLKTLHENKSTMSLVKGNLIRFHAELMYYAFFEHVRRNVNIRRCELCGNYFVPKTKKKTLYCDRVIKDGKTCKAIAPKAKQMANKNKYEYRALREYDRLYKMYYARAERYAGRIDLNRPKTEKDMSFDEFYIWSTYAAAQRICYVKGEISAGEFIDRIVLDKEDLAL